MDDPEELERFSLSFRYHFERFYGQAFPRDLVMQSLLEAVRPLFRRAKQLVLAKQRQPGPGDVCLWEACQSVSQLNGHVPTPTHRHLIRLVNNPLVQNLFLTFDEIANYSEDLPPADLEERAEGELAVKIVNIEKGAEPLGATIKATPGGGVCVARVIAGGAADRSGCFHLLEVNGVPVGGRPPDDVLRVLAECTERVVTFKLVPGGAAEPPRPRRPAERCFVRAVVDYFGRADQVQPCREAALNFQSGDILEVFLGDDPLWRQARVIGHGSLITAPLTEDEMNFSDGTTFSNETSRALPVGIIPAEVVLEREMRGEWAARPEPSGREPPPFPSPAFYEPVAVLAPGEIRPLVLVGAPCVGRAALRRCLLAADGGKFAAPVPHTSRPPRPNERHGVDYFFASRAQMEAGIAQGRFVEYGELNDNLYGTMDQSVFQLMRQGKVPVINAHPLSLRLLRTALFKPVVAFVEPPHFSLFKQTRVQAGARSSLSPQGNFLVDKDFAMIISCSAQMSAMYGRYTDFRLVNGLLEDAARELLRVFSDFETLPSWVPAGWLDAAGFKNSVC